MSSNKHFAFARKRNSTDNKKRKLDALATSSAPERTGVTSPVNASASAPASKPKPATTTTTTTTTTKRTERAANLAWKSIALPSEFGFDEDGGLLEIDEVEGVDVVYVAAGVQFRINDGPTTTAQLPKKNKTKKDHLAPTAGEPLFDSPFPDEPLEQLPAPRLQDTAVKNNATPKAKKDKKGKGKATSVDKSVHLEEQQEPDPHDILPSWAHIPLAPPLYRALAELKFDKPTAIQERALSVEIGALPYVEPEDEEVEQQDNGASDGDKEDQQDEEWGGTDAEEQTVPSAPYISPFAEEPPDESSSSSPNTTDRDIVGVAQTGSGKTLAYGLPILSYILHNPPSSSTEENPTRLAALILTPARELALQVRAAINEVAIRTNHLLPNELQDPNVNAPRKRERRHHISVVALTGGMSVEKQKRQLDRGADVLVATPGRLWDMIGENDSLARAIKGIKFLVIDEADRMIENGHFAELENIVRLTRRKRQNPEDDPEEDEAEFIDDFTISTTHSRVDLITAREDIRTFVFSATMSKDLQQNLKKRHRKFRPGRPEDGMSSLDDLLLKLDFRDPDPEVIDLTPEHGLVETLKECKVECLLPEKDVHLYHFLLRYPGRTIVFLASIDGIRRLHPLLALLGLNIVQLHSGMQQRARLKALDRFKSFKNAVLLATDVAARGLDIPAVAHVVHFQLPRTADVYVHRSGRTARAGQQGLALQLVAPDEKQVQKLLMASLGKGTDLPALPIDYSIYDQLKQRIDLAKKIETAQHKATKNAHEDNWLRQAAEAMELDIPSDFDFSDDEGDAANSKKKNANRGGKKGKNQQYELKMLKAELQKMLDKPLMMRGISAKYLTTRATVGLVDQLVEGTGHDKILGFDTSTALEDLKSKKTIKEKRKVAEG
ncbi:BQ2448_2154 [Microbotryum intermedium]|uniref:RNA helicase n=1 Tax=Microbotryum intermedium TaxID=269621 RepID=A0A238FB61_9BASI|nr:BQ2448_2154 [Microbotryum intermedium]